MARVEACLLGRLALFLLCLAAAPSTASATYSIVACDERGSCGAAVATNNLAVGASVIHAEAGVGALATQFETNPHYGARALSMLRGGRPASAVLESLLATDGNFDGQGIEYRQVGIVDAAGRSHAFTGAEAQASPWAGALSGPRYSVQGNGLVGAPVAEAMRDAFLAGTGDLAGRLMNALEAGQEAGGQTTGRLSAALLVRTREGGWSDVDLRVDAAAEPVRELRRLLDMRRAHAEILAAERAARAGRAGEAGAALDRAVRLGAGWDRIWRRAARLAMMMGEPARAAVFLQRFHALNPVWAAIEIEDELYQPLRDDPALQSWSAGRP